MPTTLQPPVNHEPPEDEPRNSPEQQPEFAQVLKARLSRRGFLATSTGMAAGATLISCTPAGDSTAPGPFGFVPVGWQADSYLHLPPGWQAEVLLRWGDPLFAEAPPFNPWRASAQAQEKQFGYNCDFTTYVPLRRDSNASTHGLLAVNHEYTLSPLMYPNSPLPDQLRPEQLHADMAAHGMTVVEVVRERSGWRYLRDSRYNRRVTPHTPMLFDGPAAGHRRLQYKGRDGFHTRGTWNNCAGGLTPWGTVLTAEENFNAYFQGNPAAGPEAENHKRYGVSGDGFFRWDMAEERWQLDLDPGYPLHAGWIVEIDPRRPESAPIKHTALGRMKHEGCTTVVNGDGRLVCYMGDDQRFEYLYRYVSRGRMSSNPQEQRQLLQDGELSVALFRADGTLHWLPLVYGRSPLDPSQGFHDQGEVLLNTRRAADLLGATPMDRPEGIAVDPDTGRVYCAMTNNTKRTEINSPNPRVDNAFGHILELRPPAEDHTANSFKWEIFLLAGRNVEESGLQHPSTDAGSYFVNPDNLAFDPTGVLWIATDGADKFGLADTLMACAVSGSRRRLASRFLSAPLGAEVTGPSFTPDGTTLFASIQHPGAVEGSNFEQPATRWPDFRNDTPPRPSVVAVTRTAGGRILS